MNDYDNEKYIKKRIIKNKSFFFDKNNKQINNIKILDKISKIYIPPAYKDVKIYLNSPILATGIDVAGRKQYIYSEESKELREEKKYCQLVKMSHHMYKLKKEINNNLYKSKSEFDKTKMICIVLKIMDLCNFRIGNKIYEKKYGSYGITTLHKKHMKIYNDHIVIEFIGKKGVLNNCTIRDSKFIPILKSVYKKAQRERNPYLFDVSMSDINEYLDSFSISSKDMRMWNANMIFLKSLDEEMGNESAITKKMVISAIKNTALALHNTATVCKKSYIYKELFDLECGIKFERGLSYEEIFKKILKKNKNYKLCF